MKFAEGVLSRSYLNDLFAHLQLTQQLLFQK